MNFRNIFSTIVSTVVENVDVEKIVAGFLYDKIQTLSPEKKEKAIEISKVVERVGEIVVATARGLNEFSSTGKFPDPIKEALNAWKNKQPTPKAYKDLFRI